MSGHVAPCQAGIGQAVVFLDPICTMDSVGVMLFRMGVRAHMIRISGPSESNPIRGSLSVGPGIAWLLALFLGCTAGPAQSQTTAATGDVSPAAAPAAIQSLDGMNFRGPVGMKGKPRRREDSFIFEDGQFISENCKAQGFTPDAYWVRQEGDAIHFRAELKSPEHGTIVYEGQLRGDELEASFVWTKKRWYWNVERDFWFKGKLAKD